MSMVQLYSSAYKFRLKVSVSFLTRATTFSYFKNQVTWGFKREMK